MAKKNDSRGANDVDVEPGGQPGAHVLDAVGERVGELEVRRRPGLLHVVAGDRDRVELGHLGGGVGEDVRDDRHRRCRWVDVRVADHELLEDVVLDRPGELGCRHALLLGGDDVERHHRQHGPVHRHRHADHVEGDAVEQLAHVEDRVDRHSGHPDVAGDAGMIAVVATVGGQVEGDGEALLSCGEVAAIEGVGLFGRREAGVLTDRPRLGHVHRRVGPAEEWGDAGVGVEEVDAGEVGGGVQGRRRRCLPASSRPSCVDPLPPAIVRRRTSRPSPSSGRPAKSGTRHGTCRWSRRSASRRERRRRGRSPSTRGRAGGDERRRSVVGRSRRGARCRRRRRSCRWRANASAIAPTSSVPATRRAEAGDAEEVGGRRDAWADAAGDPSAARNTVGRRCRMCRRVDPRCEGPRSRPPSDDGGSVTGPSAGTTSSTSGTR